jgi:hypothetical protein
VYDDDDDDHGDKDDDDGLEELYLCHLNNSGIHQFAP